MGQCRSQEDTLEVPPRKDVELTERGLHDFCGHSYSDHSKAAHLAQIRALSQEDLRVLKEICNGLHWADRDWVALGKWQQQHEKFSAHHGGKMHEVSKLQKEWVAITLQINGASHAPWAALGAALGVQSLTPM